MVDPPNDAEMVARARTGDDLARETLVRQHQEPIFRLAYLLLGELTPAAPQLEIDLPGETTLEAARDASPVLIPLPPDLGSPDRVFVLSQVGDTVVLVWEEEGIALYVVPPGPLVHKLAPENVRQTTVNGRPAIWTAGDHFLELVENDPEQQVFITSHVLIWMDGDVTYRLETDLPLVEAILIAESLK